MKPEPYLDALGIPSLSEKDHKPYIDLITIAIDWAHKNKNAPPHVVGSAADFVIYISFLKSDTEWWTAQFRDAQKKARSFYRDPITYWGTIAVGVTNRKVFEECKKLLPSLDPENYSLETSDPPASKQIAPELAPVQKKKHPHKRGELWKLDRRWEHLWPSSRKVFAEILRRTQYPRRPENFPWCQAGVKSLKKFTGVSVIQVRRALIQLERFKLIKRIVRGYKDQGVSKYLVFIVPAMSGAFSRKSLHAKKHLRPRKRISRIA